MDSKTILFPHVKQRSSFELRADIGLRLGVLDAAPRRRRVDGWPEAKTSNGRLCKWNRVENKHVIGFKTFYDSVAGRDFGIPWESESV